MIHGHTFLKWSERTGKHVQNQADNLTSVNYRIDMRDNAYGSWKQNDEDTGRFFLKRGSETHPIHPALRYFFSEGGPERGNYATLLSLFFAFCADIFFLIKEVA